MVIFVLYRKEKVKGGRETIYCLDNLKGEFCASSRELELLPMACVNSRLEIKPGLDTIISLKKHKTIKEGRTMFNQYAVEDGQLKNFMRDYLIYKSNIEENMEAPDKNYLEHMTAMFHTKEKDKTNS